MLVITSSKNKSNPLSIFCQYRDRNGGECAFLNIDILYMWTLSPKNRGVSPLPETSKTSDKLFSAHNSRYVSEFFCELDLEGGDVLTRYGIMIFELWITILTSHNIPLR